MNLKENLKKAQESSTAEPAPVRPRYIIRDAAYALQPRPPINKVVENLLNAGSVSLFFGEPGSKKTSSILSLAVCVALGKPWVGFATQAVKVLVIDEENGENRIALRLAAAIRGELGDASTQIEFISLAGFKLDQPTDVQEIEKLVRERGIGLVIIDALAEIMDGDENSKQDVQPVLSAIRKIAETTLAAIILIHHSNRNGAYRGSSAIKGSIDLMVQVESDNGSNLVHFRTVKNRDGEALSWYAKATWTEDQFYLTRLDQKEEPKQRPASELYVLDFLQNNGPTDVETLKANAKGCSADAALAATYRLVKEKLVTRSNLGGKGVKAVYELVNPD